MRPRRSVWAAIAAFVVLIGTMLFFHQVRERQEVEQAAWIAMSLLRSPEEPTPTIYDEFGAPRAYRTMNEVRLYFLLEAQEYDAEDTTAANFLLGVYFLGAADCGTALHYFERHLEESGSVRNVDEAVELLRSAECNEDTLRRAGQLTEAQFLLSPDSWLAQPISQEEED